jgi:hypothetical protein
MIADLAHQLGLTEPQFVFAALVTVVGSWACWMSVHL